MVPSLRIFGYCVPCLLSVSSVSRSRYGLEGRSESGHFPWRQRAASQLWASAVGYPLGRSVPAASTYTHAGSNGIPLLPSGFCRPHPSSQHREQLDGDVYIVM